jgi:metallo-beta-lactamase family protein
LDVFIDSPMAASVTRVFAEHSDCLNPAMRELVAQGPSPLAFPGLHTVRTVEESCRINTRREPAVIMATSGMCVAGRIKHHLRHNITRPESTILFVGYQGSGTLGRQILDGSKEVRIHGRYWPVRAEIAQIHGFSGHADHDGLMHWLSGFQHPPQQVFLTHGEEEESLKLAECIRHEKGWQVSVPEFRQTVELGGTP